MMQPALCFEPGTFPGLPGPAVGPQGPKIGQKPGAGFIILSSPKVGAGFIMLASAKVCPAGEAASPARLFCRHQAKPDRRQCCMSSKGDL